VKSSANNPSAFSEEPLDAMIHEIREQRVMLGRDLARVYGVTTKAFN